MAKQYFSTKLQGSIKSLLQKNKRFQLLLSGSVIFLTTLILGIIIYREREIIFSYDWELHLLPAVLSLILFSVALVLAGVLWGWINRELGSNINYSTHIQYYVSSNLAKRIPGTLWYVGRRAQLYYTDGIDMKFTSIASGVELTLIIISGIIISLLFAIQILVDYIISLWLFIGAFILGIIIIHPTVLAYIFKRFRVKAPRIGYHIIFLWLLSYGLLWIIGGMVLFCIGNTITSIPFEYIGYIIGSWTVVGILSSLLFFSPSNFGITEIGLSMLLARIMPLSVGIIIAIVSRILIIVYEILWALAVVGYQSLSEKNNS